MNYISFIIIIFIIIYNNNTLTLIMLMSLQLDATKPSFKLIFGWSKLGLLEWVQVT